MGQWQSGITDLVNSLAPGRCGCNVLLDESFSNSMSHFQTHIKVISCEIALGWMPQDLWWLVSIVSGNGLVPSGTKPFPETMFTNSILPYGVTRPQWVKWCSDVPVTLAHRCFLPVYPADQTNHDVFSMLFYQYYVSKTQRVWSIATSWRWIANY